ncbi:MAG: N-6 DNA methylase [Polyangiales bacterium]
MDWRAVGAEELGSVYESLLELSPSVASNGTFELKVVSGNDRKTTGAYYTPSALVEVLLEQSLDPVLDEACAKPESERQEALLSLTVCDPACGSGHFLLAAARRIARRLAGERAHGNEPSPEAVRHALREVIARCIYGVDINPMAVELCKVSLWMEALEPGLPLSFLDGHIQCGNALLGATPALMRKGIPEGAFDEIEGDEKSVVSSLRRQNKSERAGQLDLGDAVVPPTVALAASARAVEARDDRSLESVREKQRAYESLVQGASFQRAKFLADAWCAAFVLEKTHEKRSLAITESVWRTLVADPSSASSALRAEVERLAREYQFFHWQIAFPQVFGDERASVEEGDVRGWAGGFDVVLGNPPWERVKLQEKEWFAARAPEIATAANASERGKLIKALPTTKPELWKGWRDALRVADGQSVLLRLTGRFALTGRGDVNTYSVFAEHARLLLADRGRASIVCPPGLVTDDGNKLFFQSLVQSKSLVSAFEFENEEKIFPAVDHRFRFMTVSMSGALVDVEHPQFAFGLRHIEDVRDPQRRYSLSSRDFTLLNPNTGTCPTFRSRRDAEINRAIYARVPVLWREGHNEENPWNASFLRMLDMANDSHLFRSHDQLESEGAKLNGNVFTLGDERWVPLLEAKMVRHFDHRFGTYEGQTDAQSNQGKLPELTDEDHADPNRVTLPWWWVPEREVDECLAKKWDRGWMLGWRDIARSVDQRTLISCVVPREGASHGFPLAFLGKFSVQQSPLPFVAGFNSLVADYVVRQKVGGTHLTFFIIKQLPIPAPTFFSAPCDWDRSITRLQWLVPRVLELTYTAWDLEAFARDCGYDGAPFRWDSERRFELRCELDAAFFHWYGLAREDVGYVMETFPIVKRKDEEAHGGVYRTKERILALYDGMQRAKEQGAPWESALRPGPADEGVAHTSERPAWLRAWSEKSAPRATGEPGALVLEAGEGAAAKKGRGKKK